MTTPLEIAEKTVELLSSVLFNGYNLDTILISWGKYCEHESKGATDTIFYLFTTLLHEPWEVEINNQYLSLYNDRKTMQINMEDLNVQAKQGLNIVIENSDLFFKFSEQRSLFSDAVYLRGFRFTEALKSHFNPIYIIKLLCLRGLGSSYLHNCFNDMRQSLYLAFTKILITYIEKPEKSKFKEKYSLEILEIIDILTVHIMVVHNGIKEKLEEQIKKIGPKPIEDIKKSLTFQYQIEKNPDLKNILCQNYDALMQLSD